MATTDPGDKIHVWLYHEDEPSPLKDAVASLPAVGPYLSRRCITNPTPDFVLLSVNDEITRLDSVLGFVEHAAVIASQHGDTRPFLSGLADVLGDVRRQLDLVGMLLDGVLAHIK